MSSLVLIALFWIWQEVPFKPKEQFEIKLNYQFKQRPENEGSVSSTIHLSETKKDYDRRMKTGPLPFLTLNINMLQLPGETRVRITNNHNRSEVNKKVKEGMILPLELGFTDDVKDRVSPHLYILSFLSDDRKEVSRIVINVEEDGTFLVNNEKRGKF
jgi:hypothetical protein